MKHFSGAGHYCGASKQIFFLNQHTSADFTDKPSTDKVSTVGVMFS